jgi:hypothetical protein
MVANAGPALAAASSCGRQSAWYGIWYASDDVVKTGQHLEVSKTLAT